MLNPWCDFPRYLVPGARIAYRRTHTCDISYMRELFLRYITGAACKFCSESLHKKKTHKKGERCPEKKNSLPRFSAKKKQQVLRITTSPLVSESHVTTVVLQFVLSVLLILASQILTIHSHSAGENYGSDFSVSTLLHTNPPPADSATTSQGYGNSMRAVYDSTPTQPPSPSGWQLLLPSDQGVVESCDHSVGYQPAPNMSLLTHSYTQPHPTGYGHAGAYQLRAPPSYDGNG